jgi:hypothetical protein
MRLSKRDIEWYRFLDAQPLRVHPLLAIARHVTIVREAMQKLTPVPYHLSH